MRAIVALLLACGGCALVPKQEPRHYDIDTGEAECETRRPMAATGSTVVLGMLAGWGAYKVRHPDVQQRDMYGYPSNIALGPDFYRGVEDFSGATAIVTAAVATLEWAGYAHCSRTADLIQELVNARDCPTVLRLDATLARRDAEIERSVRADEPMVTTCLGEAGAR